MKPEELADEIEALARAADTGSWDDRAKASASLRNKLFVNLPAILSALRRVEKLEAALEKIEVEPGYDGDVCRRMRVIARQALTGEA